MRSTLPSSKIQELLESTGKLVVFRGYGGSTQQGDVIQEQPHHGAAVAIMKGMGAVKGLARMVQVRLGCHGASNAPLLVGITRAMCDRGHSGWSLLLGRIHHCSS